jgi:circadian clock protein KaiC
MARREEPRVLEPLRKAPTGIPRLDTILGGEGLYRGSSVLVSGTAGTGKSSIAAQFVDAACRRGERALYFAFEESPHQIVRNMRSIGLHLEQWREQGLLRIDALRPTLTGLEIHLAMMLKQVAVFRPSVVVMDPISNLTGAGESADVTAMLTRLLDYLKSQGVTALFTSLTEGGTALERTAEGVSSLMDTWLLLRDLEIDGERNRGLYVIKSRGMAHSTQIREFRLTNQGVELVDVYVGPQGVLTGSARLKQAAEEQAARLVRQAETERRLRDLERKRLAMEAQVAALRAAYEAEAEEAGRLGGEAAARETQLSDDRAEQAGSRGADAPTSPALLVAMNGKGGVR